MLELFFILELEMSFFQYLLCIKPFIMSWLEIVIYFHINFCKSSMEGEAKLLKSSQRCCQRLLCASIEWERIKSKTFLGVVCAIDVPIICWLCYGDATPVQCLAVVLCAHHKGNQHVIASCLGCHGCVWLSCQLC